MAKEKNLFATQACTGCRSCEFACSFHHQRVFSPSIASIKIIDQSKQLGFAVSLFAQKEDQHLGCDNCNGLDERFCVKYCSPLMKAELNDILNRFQANR